MSKEIPTTKMGNVQMVDDMNVGSTIDGNGLEEEVDSPGIATYELVDPPSASYVIKKGTDMQTVHTMT